jgi:hypothetical protein
MVRASFLSHKVELDSDTISFYVNGKNYTVKHPDPSMTLLEFLRSNGLTGTKLGFNLLKKLNKKVVEKVAVELVNVWYHTLKMTKSCKK